MEESGENWPSNSDVEICDEVIFEDGESESICDDDEDHYCEEIGDPTNRKGRSEREITEKMMELSAAIGLKTMDDTLILVKAREYMEKLQNRVKELEQEVGSNICSNKRTKLNSDDYKCGGTSTNDDIILEVKAKVLQKVVLIIIHCEKQNGIVLKILSHLENLHLSCSKYCCSSVLRFGKSIFDITIVAQMGDGYNTKVDELVKTLIIAISAQ